MPANLRLTAFQHGFGQAYGGEHGEPVRRLHQGLEAQLHEPLDQEFARLCVAEGADGQEPYTVARTADRFELVYEAGPLGIATGGAIHLQVSPFWDWSTPQVVDPESPGYTEVRPADASLEIRAETLDQQLLGVEIVGRAMQPGERIHFVYGAGEGPAMTDRYAERLSRFWFAVDGDGDGSRRFLTDSPGIEVRPGPARALHFTVPTIARPGEQVRLTFAFVDATDHPTRPPVTRLTFSDPPPGIELPREIHLPPDSWGHSLEVRALTPGTYRLVVRAGDFEGRADPLIGTGGGPQVLVVTSTAPSEGKSIVAVNLALAFAADSHDDVLLLDADLRRPTIGRWISPPPELGLTEVLDGRTELEHTVLELKNSTLDVLPAGTPPRDPVVLLSSTAARDLFEALRKKYKRIIVDTPPVMPFADADAVGVLSDGVLMVARSGKTRSALFRQAIQSVTSTRILGVIFNEATFNLADRRTYPAYEESYYDYYDKGRSK